MANININVGVFQCESPVINDVVWTGVRYVFSVDWSSQGDYYSTFDPSTTLELSMDINEVANSNLVYSGTIGNGVPFNDTNYTFDVLDFYPGFSGKYQITLTLKLTNTGCNNVDTYLIPVNYP